MHASVPAELDTVVAKGMAKKPDERYTTTKEMATAARAAITAPMTRPQWMPPTEPVHRVEDQAELFNRPHIVPNHQPPATGGVSPSAPTQFGRASEPNLQVPLPYGVGQPAPKKSRTGLRIALASVVVAVVVIVAVVVAISLTSGDHGKPPPGNAPSTALPNTGPFTGTYTADFGPFEDLSGKPVEGATGETQRWDIRSVCRSTGCVATATAKSGPTLQSKFVFDDVGGQWIAVDAALVTLPRFKDCRFPADYWEVVTLHPRPDGSLSGDYTTESNDCYIHRAVTFTRSGDVDISALPDPAAEPPRVTSPAESLHGGYHNELIYSDGTKYEDDYGVRTTDCLRTGDRCMSFFLNPKYFKPLVFGNGKWTQTAEFDSPCPAGGTSHVKDTSEFPLPQPPQDPITLLTGHGHVEVTGSACTGADYDDKLVRTGD